MRGFNSAGTKKSLRGTPSQELKIMSYSQTPERLAYETQCRERTASRLPEALAKTLWTPLGDLRTTTKSKLHCRCKCGVEAHVRVRELLDGKSNSCRSCSSRLRMLAVPIEIRVQMAQKASSAAAVVNAAQRLSDPLRNEFGYAVVTSTSNTGAGAKQRCTNPNTGGFADYGGRGIEFRFPSVRAFTEWVLRNIGPKPSATHSLDRIDNSRHYEPGNLRWATRSEQARNKRMYKRTNNGQRIRILLEHRPDLTYETLRLWIKQGATNDDILQRTKYARTSL